MTLRTRPPRTVVETIVEFLVGAEVRPAVDRVTLGAVSIDPVLHPHVDFFEIRVNHGHLALFQPRKDPFAVLGIQPGQRFMRNSPVLQIFSGVPIPPIFPRPRPDDNGRPAAHRACKLAMPVADLVDNDLLSRHLTSLHSMGTGGTDGAES
jgi:hypothetical protein